MRPWRGEGHAANEVCYPLYGHELDEETTPIEAGVGFFVALDKGNSLDAQFWRGKRRTARPNDASLQDDGQMRAATAALSDLERGTRGRAHRGSGERHAKSIAWHGHRMGYVNRSLRRRRRD